MNIKTIALEAGQKLGLKTEMAHIALEQALDNIITFDKKQSDYGSGNISAFGEVGVLVRCNDKINRLRTLIYDNDAEPTNEAVIDSWLDLANYGLIGSMCNKGTWK